MIRVSLAATFAALMLAMAPAHAQAPSLTDPASLKEQAPATYKVNLDTTKGPVVIEVTRAWAPNGADRFYNLVKNGYYDNTRFFRVVSGFMAQFGINGDPEINSRWRACPHPGRRAQGEQQARLRHLRDVGTEHRTTQVFINFDDNSALDRQGFAAVRQGHDGHGRRGQVLRRLRRRRAAGRGPDQNLVQFQGNAYLDRLFPMLDYIKKATIVP